MTEFGGHRSRVTVGHRYEPEGVQYSVKRFDIVSKGFVIAGRIGLTRQHFDRATRSFDTGHKSEKGLISVLVVT